MPRTTLYDIRYNTRTALALQLCREDVRVADFVNEAQDLLLSFGRWWGTITKWSICAVNGCVTLPAQLASVERAAVCHGPIPVHDYWFEFLDNGWGTAPQEGSGCAGNCGIGDGMNYVGSFPSFDDVRGVNKKLNVICDLGSDVGKEVLLLGYDENRNWIRTEQDGVIADGEVVALAQSAGTLSTKLFSSVTDIQPATDLDGQWWLYEYNTTAATKRMIGRYDYWEQRPHYPRYRVSGIWGGAETNGDCKKTLIEVLAKLAFVPVKKDTDYLVIGNRTAIKEACLAIKLGEKKEDIKDSESRLSRALRALDKELDVHLGAGRHIGVNVQGLNMGAGEIPNFM